MCFYRAIDCHRLFLFFDLFAEMMTLEGHGLTFTDIAVLEPGISRRREYYFRLLEKDPPLKETMATEEALLCEHPQYTSDPKPPNANYLEPESILKRIARKSFDRLLAKF